MSEIKNIAKALVKAQSEMSNAVKGSKNPFFKNTYADLNAIREAVTPHLNNNGICVLQPIVQVEGKNYVRTMLLHESGESITSDTEIIASQMNNAQSHGSGITYARRYGLQSLICIGSDDDDGTSASNTNQVDINEGNLLKCNTLKELEVCYLSLNKQEQVRLKHIKDELKYKLANQK